MYITGHQPTDFEIVSEVTPQYLDTVWLMVAPGMTLQFSLEEARCIVTQIEDALYQLRSWQSAIVKSGEVGPDAGAASAKLD